jgi:putative membrane protein
MHSFKRAGIMALGALLALQLSAAETPTDPSGFVNGATQAGLLEVQLAQMALTTSANPAVKQFATRMVTDHAAANAELAAIAKAKGIAVPAALDADHSKMMHALHGQTGKAFDAAYAAHMVQDHAAALELFQANVSHPDGELATFAGKTLPVLQEHKRLADNLQANIRKK